LKGISKLGRNLFLLRQIENNERPVKLFITLTPESPEGHLVVLSEPAEILSDKNIVNKDIKEHLYLL
jgi:hypothetical protein